MKVGAFVKPTRPPLTWRLGVVESMLDDGRLLVRSYVAPPDAYEGTTAVYRPEEIAEVPRDRVVAFLSVTRAEIAQREQLARQIEAALQAAG